MPVFSRRGFTVIELMLAMTFISVLLLAIAITSIQAGRMYNRGVTLKSINSAGRDISDTLRRDFLQTDSRLISNDGRAIEIVEGRWTSGRLCLGGYSYLWNVPAEDNVEPNGATVLGPDSRPINFVRYIDEEAVMCQRGEGGYPNRLDQASRLRHLLKPSSGDEAAVALHSLELNPVAVTEISPEGLYSLSFVIGTNKLSEINTSNQSCKPPSDSESNQDFCSINKFEMIVRTNG